jgi:cysteinyl-tRNA synthetase
VLGIGLPLLHIVGTAAMTAGPASATGVGSVTPLEVSSLLEQRQAARKARDFKRADTIRDELKAKGWVIEDTPKGPRLKKI